MLPIEYTKTLKMQFAIKLKKNVTLALKDGVDLTSTGQASIKQIKTALRLQGVDVRGQDDIFINGRSYSNTDMVECDKFRRAPDLEIGAPEQDTFPLTLKDSRGLSFTFPVP